MDIIFQKGSYQKFNSSTFDEGNVCFVSQLVNNEKNYDYIYRIGADNTKIPLLGQGYSFENKDSEFKVLKDTFNCNDKVKLGEMIKYELTDDITEELHSWSIPSIQGCGSTKNGEKAGNFFILDVEAEAGGIAPNPNKKLSLGSIYARWHGLYLETGISCEGNLLIDVTATDESVGNIILKPGESGCVIAAGKEQTYKDSDGNDVSTENKIQIKNQCYKRDDDDYFYPGIIVESGKTFNDYYGKLFFLDTTTDLNEDIPGTIVPIRSNLVNLGAFYHRWDTIYTQYIDVSEDISAKNISASDVQKYTDSDGNDVFTENKIQIKNQCCERNGYSYPGIIVESGKTFNDYFGKLFFLDTTTDLDEATFGTIVPTRSNRVNLGGDSLRWRTMYAETVYYTGIGNLSDKRFKEIQPLDILKMDLQVYDSLEPVCYKYKNVLLNDDYSRIHIGFFAQDVAKKIEEAGLTSEECALVQADPLTEETSEELKKICTDGYQYYLNYNELHGLHTLKNHQQDDRLAALEEKNAQLENTISELRTQIELLKLAIGG